MISFSVGPAQLIYCTSHLPPRIFTDRPELASEMKLRLLMLFFAAALAPQNAHLSYPCFFPQCLMDVAQNHGKWMCTASKHDQICSSKACVANIPEVGIRNLSTFVVNVAAICQANRSKLMDAAKLEPEDHQAEFFLKCFSPNLVFSLPSSS